MISEYHLFIFFRDFRLQDNIGLTETLSKYTNVIPIFIFNDEQINPKRNKYFSNNAVEFLCNTLTDLDRNLKTNYNRELYMFYGSNVLSVLESISKEIKILSINFNMDYTPYALNRQDKLFRWCKQKNIIQNVYEDYLLAPIGTFLKNNGEPYNVYTPFKNLVYKKINSIQSPISTSRIKYQNITKCNAIKRSINYIGVKNTKLFYKSNPNKIHKGSRLDGLKKLEKTRHLNYDVLRNDLSFSTSYLSPYIKFGLLSIREVFWFFHKHRQQGLMDQIVWREFYFHICYYYPDVLNQSSNFNPKYNDIKWVKNKKHLDAWKQGNTGYPIIDACMKELNTTGYMHNRGRLITSNFLNRILGMDWRDGEKYFAQMLVDYDPAVNNGNWQWIASTGTDTKPASQRLFNPWLQSEKYDKDATYIKKWLPELKHIPAAHLHKWYECHQKYDLGLVKYSSPIIDYAVARQRSLNQYRL